jgi:hypothetical protein
MKRQKGNCHHTSRNAEDLRQARAAMRKVAMPTHDLGSGYSWC